ncbi:hypothetical protein Tco_0855799 [Tanacetum coccineum]
MRRGRVASYSGSATRKVFITQKKNVTFTNKLADDEDAEAREAKGKGIQKLKEIATISPEEQELIDSQHAMKLNRHVNSDTTHSDTQDDDDDTNIGDDDFEGDDDVNEAEKYKGPAPTIGYFGFSGYTGTSRLNSQDGGTKEEKQDSDSFDPDQLINEPKMVNVSDVNTTKVSKSNELAPIASSSSLKAIMHVHELVNQSPVAARTSSPTTQATRTTPTSAHKRKQGTLGLEVYNALINVVARDEQMAMKDTYKKDSLNKRSHDDQDLDNCKGEKEKKKKKLVGESSKGKEPVTIESAHHDT